MASHQCYIETRLNEMTFIQGLALYTVVLKLYWTSERPKGVLKT